MTRKLDFETYKEKYGRVMAITKLEESLMWLRKRTQDREARNVEGTSVV
jgi:hypothetical protein